MSERPLSWPVSIRLPVDTNEFLRQRAAQNGTTLTAEITRRLEISIYIESVDDRKLGILRATLAKIIDEDALK